MGGDPPPPPTSESTNEMMQAWANNLPQLVSALSQQMPILEGGKLATAKELSPEWMKLQQQLFDAFGPSLAKTGAGIIRDNALSQAGTDLAVVQGPGRQLVQEATKTQREADPEFYRTRELQAGKQAELLNSITPNDRLSGGESEAMRRAMAQEQQRRGIATAPSNIAALESATRFGDKARMVGNERRMMLNQALATGYGGLPTMRSGMDVFQVATGRPSAMNTGDNKFLGANQNMGQDALGVGMGFLGNVNQMQMQKNDINANRRDSLDRFAQVMGSMPSVS